MTPEKQQKLRALIKKHHIYFDRLSDPEQWPPRHQETFNNISRLAKTEFTQYRESVTIDSAEKPWGDQTRCRSERIASLAQRCLEGRKNEAGWRMSLESEILARFTIEVACRKCRARLWRSEVEAAVNALDGFRDSLEERRKKRTPCRCRSGNGREDLYEQGINPLFDDRAQEPIIHEDALRSEMPKREEPDRIYGLRKTRKLDRLLLWTEDKRPSSFGKPIGDTIKSSPFRPDGEPLLFPFLVLEAKSEKGRDGFSDVEVQTALTIRTLLKLQEDLRKSAGEESEWETGPLVWFLSNKGEQWRVAAAYIEYEKDIPHYHVVDLWDGRIISKDGALRLLLIVDYIFDWARDIYREAVIGELTQLAGDKTPSLGRDSELYSSIDRVDLWHQEGQTEVSSEPHDEEQPHIQEVFQGLDSPHGIFRDAKYIQSRFLALYITEDNLTLLMESIDNSEQSQKLARNILRCLKESWRVTREALDELELTWTGKDREDNSVFSPDKVFFVVTTVNAYLSPSWEQNRELSYLAVSEAAIDPLLQCANLERGPTFEPSAFPGVEKSVFVGFFRIYLSTPVKDNLTAAISRSCKSTQLYSEKVRGEQSPDVTWVPSIEEVERGVKYRLDAAIIPDRHAHARELVLSIYMRNKIGRTEPTSSFLRVSNRWDEQNRNADSINLWSEQDLPVVEGQKVLFVASKNPSNMPHYPELCVFLLHEPRKSFPDGEEPLRYIPNWQYQARRLDLKPGWGRGWNNQDVKIQDDRFPQMIEKLQAELRKKDPMACAERVMNSKKKGLEYRPKSPRVWGSKPTNSDFVLTSLEPSTLESILELQKSILSGGLRLTSVTDICTNRERGKFQGSKFGNFLALPHLHSSELEISSPGRVSSVGDSPEKDGEMSAVKAGKRKATSTETNSIPNPITTSQRSPTIRAWGPNRGKRAVEDSGEGPSKRQDVKPTPEFSGDFLSQDELDRLLSEGCFG